MSRAPRRLLPRPAARLSARRRRLLARREPAPPLRRAAAPPPAPRPRWAPARRGRRSWGWPGGVAASLLAHALVLAWLLLAFVPGRQDPDELPPPSYELVFAPGDAQRQETEPSLGEDAPPAPPTAAEAPSAPAPPPSPPAPAAERLPPAPAAPPAPEAPPLPSPPVPAPPALAEAPPVAPRPASPALPRPPSAEAQAPALPRPPPSPPAAVAPAPLPAPPPSPEPPRPEAPVIALPPPVPTPPLAEREPEEPEIEFALPAPEELRIPDRLPGSLAPSRPRPPPQPRPQQQAQPAPPLPGVYVPNGVQLGQNQPPRPAGRPEGRGLDLSVSPRMLEGRAATDPLVRVTGAQVGADWRAAFRRWLEENIRYPQEAIRLGEDGRVQVSVLANPDGTVRSVRLVLPSTSPALNRATSWPFNGARLPPFPPGADPNGVTVDLTVNYILIRQ